MSKLQITFAAVLFNLFLGDSALAQEEKQLGGEEASAFNPAKKALETHDISVKIENDGEQIIVDASFIVPVTPRQAWMVLTDFDNVPMFNSGVLSSKVTGGAGNNLLVAQTGITKHGLFNLSFESVREIHLFPFRKIQERMISGSMRRMEETTQLLPEGNQTRITYHAVFIPGSWVPPMVGNVFIKREVREQFQEIVSEIIRRERVRVVSQ